MDVGLVNGLSKSGDTQQLRAADLLRDVHTKGCLQVVIGQLHFADRKLTMDRMEVAHGANTRPAAKQGVKHLLLVIADGADDARSGDSNALHHCILLFMLSLGSYFLRFLDT